MVIEIPWVNIADRFFLFQQCLHSDKKKLTTIDQETWRVARFLRPNGRQLDKRKKYPNIIQKILPTNIKTQFCQWKFKSTYVILPLEKAIVVLQLFADNNNLMGVDESHYETSQNFVATDRMFSFVVIPHFSHSSANLIYETWGFSWNSQDGCIETARRSNSEREREGVYNRMFGDLLFTTEKPLRCPRLALQIIYERHFGKWGG